MNKVISVAAVLALTAADNQFFLYKNIPNLPTHEHVAYDNEMVYYKPGTAPKRDINDPIGKVMITNSVHDDEMVWYPPGSGHKYRDDPFGMITHSVKDDELFIETVNDNEMAYTNSEAYRKYMEEIGRRSNPYYPSRGVPLKFPLTAYAADDELFIETATDNEMVYYKPGSGHIYPVYSSGMMTDSAHDDEQAIIRLDPREWQGFHAYDDELFSAERVEGKIHEGVKKTKDFLSHHPEAVKQTQKDVKNLSGILKKLSQGQKHSAQGPHDLSALGQLIKEGRSLHNEVKAQRTQKKSEVHDHNLNFIEDVQDNDLSFKDKIKGAVNWVGDHPQVISEGAKAIKTLRGGK